jgi:hypothetical protein
LNAVTVSNSRARSTQTRQQIGTRSTEESKESDCEELTQFAYSKIQSVVINCNSARQLANKSEYKMQNPQIIDALPGKMSQYFSV